MKLSLIIVLLIVLPCVFAFLCLEEFLEENKRMTGKKSKTNKKKLCE